MQRTAELIDKRLDLMRISFFKKSAQVSKQFVRQVPLVGRPKIHQKRVLPQQGGMLLAGFKNQFAENRVGPGKPGAREFVRVVFVKGFVHETGAGVGLLQCRQAAADFVVIRAGQSLA